jgi:hypothetical protein
MCCCTMYKLLNLLLNAILYYIEFQVASCDKLDIYSHLTKSYILFSFPMNMCVCVS